MRLAQGGEWSIPVIASDLGIADQTLRGWVQQAELDTGAREELRQLRREVRILEQEREVVQRVAAFLAGESDLTR